MKQKIKTVTEAYNMQPCSQYIGSSVRNAKNEVIGKIGEIKIETKQVESDRAVDMVCGYTEKGDLAFEWIRSAVNIEYFI